MSIGNEARALLADFRKNQNAWQSMLRDKARPQCRQSALRHFALMEPLIEHAARNGNHYIMYNSLTAPNVDNSQFGFVELHLQVVVEELKLLLVDCDVELDKSNRLRVSWKDTP